MMQLKYMVNNTDEAVARLLANWKQANLSPLFKPHAFLANNPLHERQQLRPSP